MKTLREKIEESKVWYLQKYGALDWRWTDEGLPYIRSCKMRRRSALPTS